MSARLNALSNENTQLHSEVNQFAAESSQEDSYSASLQAPAVSQSVQNIVRGRRVTQTVVQHGSIMNISVEIIPGRGRILVQTTPLMGVDFQGAANTAVAVAGQKAGFDLSKSDVIFSIDSGSQISEVDGPSAGALMTLLTLSAIEKRPLDTSLTLTGTINKDGSVGAIGGVAEKATAAKESGKTLFLVPAANQLIPLPSPVSSGSGIFSTTSSAQQVSAKEYIEKNIGISVTYVKTIDDVTSIALK
jgi:predicted S18 family serine protease